MKLLHLQPRRTLDFQVHDHLLAPKRPAFVKDSMGEQATPFARMPVCRYELQMMARISLMRAGEAEAEMLLLFGEFFGLSLFREAEVVYPKNAALPFFKCWRLRVRSSGNHHSQKFRDRLDLQSIAFRKRYRASVFETLRDPLCFIVIKLQ